MFFKKLMKQHSVPWVGAAKETLVLGLWWGVPLNFAAIMGTFYYTTVRHVAPWATPTLFFIVLGVGVAIILVAEYKLLMPSIWSWRERQMSSFQSKVMSEIRELETKINSTTNQSEVIGEIRQLKEVFITELGKPTAILKKKEKK